MYFSTRETPAPDHALLGGVSVIVPARNAAATIETTMLSLGAERGVIREIVLVDDDSNDGTDAIAASAAARSELPLTVIRGAWQNAGAARNIAISETDGEYVYFLDADDQVADGGLRALLECLRADRRAGLAIGGYVRRAQGRTEKLCMPAGLKQDRMANARNYLRNELRSIAVGSALLRREVVRGIRFPENLLFEEDTCFWTAMLTRADVALSPRVVLIYNVDEGRVLKRFTTEPRREFLKTAFELRNLEKFGIDQGALKWRKGWIAGRIARAHIKTGDMKTARRFMRVASAQPELRWSPSTIRYAFRIRLGEIRHSMSRRIGLATTECKAASH